MIRELQRVRSPETEAAILGADGAQRTPLRINFIDAQVEGGVIAVPAEYGDATPIDDASSTTAEHFNGVGSRVRRDDGVEAHLPVLDLDYGIDSREGPAGFVVWCEGSADINDTVVEELGTLLADYTLGEIEVVRHDRSPGYSGEVAGLHWFPEDEADFAWTRSSGQKGAHLLIQREISATDHEVLIGGLNVMGAVGGEWAGQAIEGEFGGIIRTPWTTKNSEVALNSTTGRPERVAHGSL